MISRTRQLHRALAAAATLACSAAGTAGPLPERLVDTGLYAEGSTSQIHAANLAFAPQYPLWSDGARKRRWIQLPPGSSIDATDPDAWDFPPGTKLWKEFALDRRIETRFIERTREGEWRYATYVWDADGRDARLAPAAGIAALPLEGGRTYPIPGEYDCRACHEGAAVPVLGFSALQLSADRDPLAPHAEPAQAGDLDLRTLAERGRLRGLPRALIDTPPRIAARTPIERAALGYLHGNCGQCHNAGAAGVPVALRLAQPVADPAGPAVVLRSLAGPSRFNFSRLPGAPVVVPGDAHGSLLRERMRSRDPRLQMPPLGTSIPDPEGLALIERWIDQVSFTQELHP